MPSNTLTLIHMHSGPVCNGIWLEVFGSSSRKQRLVRSEQARMAEEGQMERAMQGWRDGRSRGVEGHEVVVEKGGKGISEPWAPSARNNKQAFSYSNKYQASGEQGGTADKEEARGWEPDWRMASLLHWSLFRIMGRTEKSKAGSDRFIMSVDSALAFNTGLKTY